MFHLFQNTMDTKLHLNEIEMKMQKFSGRSSNTPKLTTKQKVSNFFRNVPRELTLQLYEIYKRDFEMFDYEPEQYFKFIHS